MKKYFREIDEKDIEYLVEIEKTFPNPWPLKAFFLEMEGEFNKSLALCVDDILVGYLFYSEYLDEININHFAVDPKYRKMGYASEILKKLIKGMSRKQILYLEVHTENEAAINLYKKHGLEIIRTRKDYYSLGEDAYIMQLDRKEEL